MDEALISFLFFVGMLFNYGMRLKLEQGGQEVSRSNVREGLICGLTLYLIIQIVRLPGVAIPLKVLDIGLGIASLAVCATFFIKGRLKQSGAAK